MKRGVRQRFALNKEADVEMRNDFSNKKHYQKNPPWHKKKNFPQKNKHKCFNSLSVHLNNMHMSEIFPNCLGSCLKGFQGGGKVKLIITIDDIGLFFLGL